MGTRDRIVQAQRSWAATRGIEVDEHSRTLTLEDNLFQPLQPKTRAEFEAGAGDELGQPATPGKLASLHSSSALATNMFDYWRDRDAGPLLAALDLPTQGHVVGFEATHSTGLGGTPPHLDVQLEAAGVPVGIESKFTEPYGTIHNEFRPTYLQRNSLWKGLPRLRRLTERIDSHSVQFAHLHAAQLIKHILGLHRSYPTGAFILIYLWYSIDSPEAQAHNDEIQQFATALDDEIRFVSQTYQEALRRFVADPESQAWNRYMTDRYIERLRG